MDYQPMKKIGLVYKCVVIGDPHAGKSSILHRLKFNEFQEKTNSTIGVDFVSKIFDIKNQNIKLQIWDTAGQEIYNSIVSQYFKDVIATIIVVDPTLKTSLLAQFKYWHKKTQENSDNLEHMQYLILINKIDHPSLTNKYKEISQFIQHCNTLNLLVYESSAKQNLNIITAFIDLTQKIYSKTHSINSKKKIKGIRNNLRIYDFVDINLHDDPLDNTLNNNDNTKCDSCNIS